MQASDARAKYLAEDQMRSGQEESAFEKAAYNEAKWQAEMDANYDPSDSMSLVSLGGGVSGKRSGSPANSFLSSDELAFANNMFSKDRGTGARKPLPAGGLGNSPFVNSDGSHQVGPISAVGGFDSRGNSLNASQFDIGQSWLADSVVRAPINLFANTAELIGNNLNLSFTLPGHVDYISFMDGIKQPYSTDFGPYAEFSLGMGLGFLGAGSKVSTVGTAIRAESAASSQSIARYFQSTSTGAYSQRQVGGVLYATPEQSIAASAGGPLRAGQLHESAQLAALGLNKNNVVFRPSVEQIDSAAFKVIVGDAKYTKGGQAKGTIFDNVENGYLEIKGGSSELNSSYQLRLQTYKAHVDRQPFTIQTTRPVNPHFQGWLDSWGVKVVRPTGVR